MSVQVSYKKQFILGFLLLLILLIVVEVLVNVWLYNFYTCAFEDNEIFKDLDAETKKKICVENIGLAHTEGRIAWEKGTRSFRGLDETIVYINSEGFRSPEFTAEKPSNTFRIFTVGGSTTFAAGVFDNQTYPIYLQKIYDDSDLNFNVEVINSGWAGGWSYTETELIKERLLVFEPDLFIVFDGWNDLAKQGKDNPNASALLWKERWIEICDIGKDYGFSTIITLQPSVATGNKILTIQENESLLATEKNIFVDPYPEYIEQLEELKNHCTLTADLRGIFDHVQEPVYYDRIHTGPRGNQIIAENFYHLSLPIVFEGAKHFVSNTDNQETFNNELSNRLILNNAEFFFKDSYLTIKDLLSYYKTPRILPVFFQQ